MKQTKVLTRVDHVNDWKPAVYMGYTSQNFRLFHVSNLSILNFRIVLLMCPGPLGASDVGPGYRDAPVPYGTPRETATAG